MNHIQEAKKQQQTTALCSPRARSPHMQNILNYKEVRQEGRLCLRGEEAGAT